MPASGPNAADLPRPGRRGSTAPPAGEVTPDAVNSQKRQWRRLAWAGLIVIATLACFGRTIDGQFLGYDDVDNVLENPYFNPPSWRHLAEFWREPYRGLYMPVTFTWWGVEARLAWDTSVAARQEQVPGRIPVDPRVFQVSSLLLHTVNALLVYVLLIRLVRNHMAAAAGALLFSLHPLQVESVGWIGANTGLLSTAAALVALLSLLRYFDARAELRWGPVGRQDELAAKPRGGRRQANAPRRQFASMLRPGLWYGAGTLAFVVALFSKPSAAALPLVAGALAIGWLNVSWRQVVATLIPWLAIAGVMVVLTRGEQGSAYVTLAPGPFERLLVAGDALAFYLGKLVWPAWLGPDYGRSPAFVVEQTWRWLLWLAPIAALGLLAAFPGRRKWLAAAAMFVFALSPILGLIPFAGQNASTVADRYVYLAMLGPALALAAWLAARSGWQYLAPVGIVLTVLVVLSFRQLACWHDDDAWTARTLEVNPRSCFGLESQAHALERQGARDDALAARLKARRENPWAVEPCFRLAESWTRVGDWLRAVQCYGDALEIAPDNRLIHGSLALALLQAGDDVGARKHFQQAVDGVERDRNLSALCTTLGSRLMERGNMELAREVLSAALRLRPRSVEALNTLAVLEFRQRRLSEALAFCDAALAIDPESAGTRANRGVFLVAGGQAEEGLRELGRAIELAPRDVATRATLADALLRSDQAAAAIEVLRQGLRLQANWWEGCRRLGWLLATHPDDRLRNGREALELARSYRAASGERDVRALDLLAAAQAEVGDFDQAGATAQRAVELWRAADPAGAAIVAAERRLRQYERRMAWREPPTSGR